MQGGDGEDEAACSGGDSAGGKGVQKIPKRIQKEDEVILLGYGGGGIDCSADMLYCKLGYRKRAFLVLYSVYGDCNSIFARICIYCFREI